MSAIRRGSLIRSGVLELPPRSIPSQDFSNRDQPLIQVNFPSLLGKRRFDQANVVSNTGKKRDPAHFLQLLNRVLTLKQNHRTN